MKHSEKTSPEFDAKVQGLADDIRGLIERRGVAMDEAVTLLATVLARSIALASKDRGEVKSKARAFSRGIRNVALDAFERQQRVRA